MNSRLCPTLSLKAPIRSVAAVAVTALAATIIVISVVVPPISLKRNRLKYMFSTTQAIWPNRPNKTTTTHVLADTLFCIDPVSSLFIFYLHPVLRMLEIVKSEALSSHREPVSKLSLCPWEVHAKQAEKHCASLSRSPQYTGL